MEALQGDATERILARHPEAAEIRSGSGEDLHLLDLLWDELEVLERRRMLLLENQTAPDRRSAVGFFLRRRTLAQYTRMNAVAGRLPSMWVRVMRMDPDRLGRTGYELGIRMLGAALRHLPDAERAALKTSMTALQSKALANAERAGLIPEHSATLSELWLAGYGFARDKRGAKKAVEILGRLLLGTLFGRVPRNLQDDAIRQSKTTFCARLLELPPLEFADREDEAAGEQLAHAVVKQFSLTPDRTDDESGPSAH